MQRITNRLRDTLGEQARLELGLTTSPASVAPRWRRHLGTEQATPQPFTPAPPAPTLTLTPQQQAQAESLQRQMHEIEESLRLLRERKAAFASPTDIPLQWDKDDRAQEARLAEVREQFARATIPTIAPAHEAPISRAFDQYNGQLLILGAPGAGKTTLLLELARDLTARALADATHPIPVLVNLSSWGSTPRPLAEWLAEAMRDAVGTSKQFAQQLIAGDQLLLLLDGLDEVAAAQRAACVKAINTFLAERMQQRAVVCCRLKEYEEIGEKLTFESALQVEPLTKQQIADVLDAGGDKLAGVRQALHDEPRFRDLLTTPLMLNIVILAYSGGEAVQIAGQSPLELRRALFAAYVKRMLTRHTERLDARYRPNVQHWLAWLAHQMRRDSTTDFRVGYMQLTMLKHQRLYWLVFGLVFGLVGGLFGGLLGGLGGGLIFRLLGGLGGGLIGGIHA